MQPRVQSLRVGLWLLPAALCFLLLGAGSAFADKRVALVIGNSAYRNVTPLDNPKNDARLIADTLRSLGFSLVGGGPQLDVDKAGVDRAVQAFGAQLQGADVGLFYYAGHGVQVSGANYLVPIDANPVRQSDVDFQMLDANVVLRQMGDSGTKLNIVILDACRNNPFGTRGLRGDTRGLAQMQAPEGTLISFATQPGNVAQDGADGDSPYTKALTQAMHKPGLDIFRTFNEVGIAVASATGGAQQPWISLSPIKGDFYFAGAPAAVPSASAADQAAWSLLKETTDEAALKRFTAQYPNSPLRKDAEARIAALEAAQAAKPVPLSPDEVTWVLLKETTDEAALKRFTAQYPKSSLRKDAEARIAALAAAQAAKPELPKPDEATWALLKETTDEAALKRFAAQYPNSALRTDAETRIAALEEAQAAKPVPPKPDEVTWALIKDTTDEAALKRFTAQYPDSMLRRDAEARIAALERPAKAASEGSADSRELARSLQFELKRVGCFDGAVNGEFDDATRAAWHNFAKHASLKVPDDLSSDAIKAVRSIDKRVCPLICPEGQRAQGERCVAAAPPPAAKPGAKPQTREAPTGQSGETVLFKRADGTWTTVKKSHSFAECARNARALGYGQDAVAAHCGPNGYTGPPGRAVQ